VHSLTGVRWRNEREPLICGHSYFGLLRRVACRDLNEPTAAPRNFRAAFGQGDNIVTGISVRRGRGQAW